MHKISAAEVETRREQVRQKLFHVREQRVKPARDEKVLTGWNGLMLAAFAEAARAFKREDYGAVAEHNATFLLREMRPSTLLRSAQDAPSTFCAETCHRQVAVETCHRQRLYRASRVFAARGKMDAHD